MTIRDRKRRREEERKRRREEEKKRKREKGKKKCSRCIYSIINKPFSKHAQAALLSRLCGGVHRSRSVANVKKVTVRKRVLYIIHYR